MINLDNKFPMMAIWDKKKISRIFPLDKKCLPMTDSAPPERPATMNESL